MRACLALPLLALVAACGGATPTAGPSPTPSTSPAEIRDPAVLRAVSGDRWSQAEVVLAVGDRLLVTNADPDKGHDVSVAGVGSSPTLDPGQSFTLTFGKAGRYRLVCTIHPGMESTVVVR